MYGYLQNVNSKGKLVALKVGTVKVTATALTSGTYKKATKKVVIKIVPKKVGIKSLKSKRKRCVSVRSNKAGKGNTRYQIQYKVGKGKIKTIKRKSNKTLSYTIRGLKSGKRFKVRIRVYKKTGGKVYYGYYSKWKTLKKIK